MTHQRERIHEYIATHPEIHFNELIRSLDLAPGQVQYHLRKLCRGDEVVREPLYGRTHYYTPTYEPWERSALALLRRETTRDVLLYLLESGPSRPATVADDLDIARSTLEWHLDHLTDQDLIRKDRDQKNNVTLVPSRPVETARLLTEITPWLPDRMVDRFIRLMDNLFFE